MAWVAALLLLLARGLLVELLDQELADETGRDPARADPGGLGSRGSAYRLGLPKRGALPPCARAPSP